MWINRLILDLLGQLAKHDIPLAESRLCNRGHIVHLELSILTFYFTLAGFEHRVSLNLVCSLTDLKKIALGTSQRIVVLRYRNSLEEIAIVVLNQLANLHEL